MFHVSCFTSKVRCLYLWNSSWDYFCVWQDVKTQEQTNLLNTLWRSTLQCYDNNDGFVSIGLTIVCSIRRAVYEIFVSWLLEISDTLFFAVMRPFAVYRAWKPTCSQSASSRKWSLSESLTNLSLCSITLRRKNLNKFLSRRRGRRSCRQYHIQGKSHAWH